MALVAKIVITFVLIADAAHLALGREPPLLRNTTSDTEAVSLKFRKYWYSRFGGADAVHIKAVEATEPALMGARAPAAVAADGAADEDMDEVDVGARSDNATDAAMADAQ